jgi:cytochrome o ubiquinol oxidase subunit II
MTFTNRTSAGLLALALPLAGCGGVLDPRGPIGVSERLILIDSLAIMLVIVIPVIIATLGFAWWFRASNDRATYLPYWSFSGQLELIVWAIPALVITFLGGIAWFGSHALDPFRPLESKTAAVEVEVVSLDWKWLFIYPNDGVASVNQLGIPTGMPVHFKLTSSGVMNSFFVPQLGGQIYTMAGMTSQLSLQADQPGDYPGISAQFSGDGFSDMRFVVHALLPDDYAKWIASAKAGGKALDTAAYAALARQSSNVLAVTYHSVDPKLFDAIVDETAPPSGSAQEQPGGHSTSEAGGGG